MAESLKHTAKIKARGLDNTGVTEDLARQLASSLGTYTMMIVEAVADTVTTDAEGKQQVTLRLTQVEPIPESHEDTVREFGRALSRNRRTAAGELALPGTDEGPGVDDAAKQMEVRIERDEDGRPTGVWDGNPDSPIAAVPDLPADPETAADEGQSDEHGDRPGTAGDPEQCPAPGCQLPEDHDGAHQVGSSAKGVSGGKK